MSNFFHAYHIGGRAGSVSFKRNNKFNHIIQEFIFDADEECGDIIKIKNPKAKVFSYCLDKTNGFREFFLNKNRYTSSFLKPLKDNLNFYQSINGENMLLSDACSAEKTIEVQTYTLDYLLEENKIEKIDFISLDTQGSELDIIKGGINSLKKDIIAVQLEVSLIDIYENGSSFFEINKFLNDNNFLLYKLEPLYTDFKYNIPNKIVKNKFSSQAEALYIFNRETITDSVRMEKLGFFSLLYGYTDIAFASFDFLKKQKHIFFDDNYYIGFVEEFYNLVKDENYIINDNSKIYNYSKDVSKVDKIVKKFPDFYNYSFIKKVITCAIYDRKYLISKIMSAFKNNKKKNTKIDNFFKKYEI